MEWLKEILPDAGRVVTDGIEERYLSDTLGRLRGRAAALVFAESTEEVSGILREAHRRGVPVTPRGAGTNLVGSTVPADGGIVLDFTRMNRILELDRDTMTVTVEPGILLEDLQRYVENEGLFYPPDPGEKASTIGGNISTNAGGMRAVKYGVTRDYVRGLEVVLADGTVMTVGGKNVKDASGLSLKNLFIGSEGTLCVITKCILRLIPKPAFSKSALVPYPDLESGIRSVLTVLQADVNPTAVEFIQRDVVKLGEDFSGVRYPPPRRRLLYSADLRRSQVRGRVGARGHPRTDAAHGRAGIYPAGRPRLCRGHLEGARRAGQGGGGRLGAGAGGHRRSHQQDGGIHPLRPPDRGGERPADGQLRPCGRRQRAPLRGARRPQRGSLADRPARGDGKGLRQGLRIGRRALRRARHRPFQAALFPPRDGEGKHSRDEPHQGRAGPQAYSQRPKILHFRRV